MLVYVNFGFGFSYYGLLIANNRANKQNFKKYALKELLDIKKLMCFIAKSYHT